MPSNKPGSRLIRAAGGVAWRPGPDGSPQVLLVHRKKYDDWSLPKGKIEPGEPLPVTAVREVLEEGGARLALGRRLGSVRYNVGGRPKRVHYWAARVLSVDSRAIPNAEVDEVAWLPAERAVEKVSYPHDHGVLADFAARPPHTVPLILLRHAKALPKGSWKHADAERPLDDSGRDAAKALADLLACFSPSFRLISSPAARCTDTLRPLSQLTGDKVRQEPSLYAHAQPGTGAADPGTVSAALIRAAIASGEPTVICAHRENLPALRDAALAALAGYSFGGPMSGVDALGADALGADASVDGEVSTFELPKDWDETLPPGGFWVLNIASLPAESELGLEPGPRSQPEAGPAPEQATPAPDPASPIGPARGRTWWQRLRTLARRDGAARRGGAAWPEGGRGDGAFGGAAGNGHRSGQLSSPGADSASGRLNGGAGSEARRPVGALISADRYDLADPSES
jgi:8-oxo-dGTP diphosphatase